MRWIRVAVDGSRASGHALAWAAGMARDHGATLELATVFGAHGRVFASEHGIAADTDPEDVVRGRQEQMLDDHVGPAGDREDLDVRHAVLLGHPAEQLCIAKPTPDLLVLGTRGVGGFVGLLVGSTAHQVIEHAPCTTVVVPDLAAAPRAPDRMVVGIDGSAVAETALTWAVQEARHREGQIELVVAYERVAAPVSPYMGGVPVIESTSARELADGVLRRTLLRVDTSTAKTSWTVAEGHAHQVLMGRAEDADLLVLGAPGVGHATPLHIGSVAHRCLKHAPVPVAVVR